MTGSSKGEAAHSSRSPRTEQLISRRWTIARSASTVSVKEKASSIASSRPDASLTLLIPTLEPKLTGLMMAGYPTPSRTQARTSSRSSSHIREVMVAAGKTGRPSAAIVRLKIFLSMPTADDATSHPA